MVSERFPTLPHTTINNVSQVVELSESQRYADAMGLSRPGTQMMNFGGVGGVGGGGGYYYGQDVFSRPPSRPPSGMAGTPARLELGMFFCR